MVNTARIPDKGGTESPALSSWLPPDPLWQHMQLPVLLLDERRRIRYANSASCHLLGQPLENLQGFPFEYSVALDHPVEIVVTRNDGQEIVLEYLANTISWRNQTGYLISLHNVTQRKNKLRQTLQQLDLERALSGFATRFVQVVDFDRAVRETLADTGRLTDADRCYLFAFRSDDQLWELAQEWSGQDVPSRVKEGSQPPAHFLPWLTKQLLTGETVSLDNVLNLPREAEREKSFLVREGTRSWLALPVYHGSHLVGCLGLENAIPPEQWQDFDLNLLWAVAQIMGRALHHRKIEQQLEKQRAFLQQVIDINPHIIFAKDRDGRHTLVNQAMADFYNTSVKSLIGRTDREINPHQDEAVAFRRDDLEVMNTLHEKVIPEEANTNADGELRYMSTVKRPIIGSDGQATHILGVATDITVRKRAEDGLRASEQRYRQLFNSGNDSVFVYRLTPEGLPGEFFEVNDIACQRLGFSREELIGKTILDINLASDHPQILAAFQLLQRHKRSIVERTHVTFDGRLIPVEVSSHMFDLNGEPAVLSIARDITERKSAETEQERLQSQLLQSQKMEAIGRLTGGIAHDFNNMLTAISGYAEMLQVGLGDTHPSRAHADKIVDVVQRAANLIRQLLTFSRKGPGRPQVLNLNQVLGDMEDMLHRLIGEDVQLVLHLADQVWPVSLDRTQLEQVIFNLVVNARDALPAGGQLFIRTQNVSLDEVSIGSNPDVIPGDFVQVDIQDTGVGMGDEVRSHLFEPFYTTKNEDVGTGLGLATVYGIITQNGGCIQVESQEGQGATFQIFLPRTAYKANVTTSAARPASYELPTGAETILLVEDDDEVRRMVRQMLERQGYSVLEAADAETARSLYAHHRDTIQLLLVDVVLPGTHGPLLANELCTQQPDLKTLFISGYTGDTIKQYGGLKPGAAFVRKPFTPSQLLSKAREVLDDWQTPPELNHQPNIQEETEDTDHG